MLAPDTLLRRQYRLERPLGHGGMGMVYRALDEATGQPVAVKVVLGDAGPLQGTFEREAHLLARLDHPALPAVVDYFSEDPAHCLSSACCSTSSSIAARSARVSSAPKRSGGRTTRPATTPHHSTA